MRSTWCSHTAPDDSAASHRKDGSLHSIECRSVDRFRTARDDLPPTIDDGPVPAVSHPSRNAFGAVENDNVDQGGGPSVARGFDGLAVPLDEVFEAHCSGSVCVEIAGTSRDGAVRQLEREPFEEKLSQPWNVARLHRLLQSILRLIQSPSATIDGSHEARLSTERRTQPADPSSARRRGHPGKNVREP